jgi:hypothetical protein
MTDALLLGVATLFAVFLGKILFVLVTEKRTSVSSCDDNLNLQEFKTFPGAVNYFDSPPNVTDLILSHPHGSSVRLTVGDLDSLFRTTEVTSMDFNTVKALYRGDIDTIFGRRIVRA